MTATDTSRDVSTAQDRERYPWQRMIESIEGVALAPVLGRGGAQATTARWPGAGRGDRRATDYPFTSSDLMDVAQYAGEVHEVRAEAAGNTRWATGFSVAADRRP